MLSANHHRRRLLKGAGATAAGVAGCSESDGTETRTTREPAPGSPSVAQQETPTDPSSIQERIDAAVEQRQGRAPAVVRLESGRVYEVDEEVHVKPRVHLDCSGALIRPTGDHNVLFLNNGAKVFNPKIDTRSVPEYSSNAIEVNSARAADETNNYRMFQGEAPELHGANLRGSNADGTGLYLTTGSTEKGSTGPIGLGCYFEANVTDFDVGVHGEPTGGHMNGAIYEVNVARCRVGILHSGTGNFGSMFSGMMQPSSDISEYGIKVEPTDHNRSVMFTGQLWDNHHYQKYAVEGKGVCIFNYLNLSLLRENSNIGKNSTVIALGLDGFEQYETERTADRRGGR